MSEANLDYGQAALIQLDWERIHRDSLKLSQQLKSMGRPWKGLVAITRGGLVPAMILARQLDIRLVETLSIASYDEKHQGQAEVLKGAEAAMADQGEGWLVVDDLTDSGVTARLARQILPKSFFVAIYAKPKGAPTLDLWADEFDQNVWIVFPWDADEA